MLHGKTTKGSNFRTSFPRKDVVWPTSFWTVINEPNSRQHMIYKDDPNTSTETIKVWKRQCHEIFFFRFFSSGFFHESSPANPLKILFLISNLFINFRRHSQVRVQHRYRRCRWYRWQVMWQYQTAYTLKWTCRKKFIYMLTLLPKGVQTILKLF